MDERKKTVRNAYDAIAARYLDWSRESKVRAHYLETFLRLVPGNASVLELGCGAGLPVTKNLTEHCGHVTAIDISSRQIALARQNASTATYFCADMAALEFPDACFDAVCAFYAITHLPRDEHLDLFRHVARWLKPGGLFLASLGVTQADGTVNDWLGAPNFFSHYDRDENLRLLKDAGFEIETAEITEQDLPGEMGLPFLWVFARKSVNVSAT